MRRFLDRLYILSGAVGASFIVLIALFMVAQSILRELGIKTGAVNDIVSWFCAAASFFAMPHSFKHGDFVRVTLLLEKLSPNTRRYFELICLLIACISVGYLAYWANKFTYESYLFNEKAQGLLPIPIWIPQASFAIGSIVLWIAMVDEFFLVLNGKIPSYVSAVEERHAAGDFSSDV